MADPVPELSIEQALGLGAEQLSKFAEAINQAVDQHGEKAVDLALMVTRISAANEMIFGLVCAIPLTIASYFFLRWTLSKPVLQFTEGASIFSLGLLAPVIGAWVDLIDLWSWVGIFKPEIYLAYQAIQMALR